MFHITAKSSLLIALCAAWLGGFCEEKPRATGLLLPPTRQTIRPATTTRAKALLGAAKSSEPIPTSWDSRDMNWIGPVKYQGSVGACWAFACYETLETQMRRLGLGDWDFSEKNMVNLNGYTFQEGFLGNADFAQAYLLRWGGAVAETNDVYIADIAEWQKDSVPRNPPVHVQNVVWIPPRPSFTDNDELKEAIMDYGAVAVPMFFDPSFMNAKGAYYYNGSTNINHLVTVIGWDDVYSKNNFRSRPPGDGAWLVKNSWGEERGDGGYLHVSYYDTQFHMDSDAYGTVFLPASADEDYTAVYGYDWLGSVWRNISGNGEPIGAVFRAAWNEELAAIGLYSCVAPLDYKISVYTNVSENAGDPTTGGKLAYEQTGCLTNLGYSTIPLARSIPLTPGEWYSVVFENTNECERYFYVCAYWEGYSDTFTPVSDATFYKHDNNSWRDSSANKEMLFGNICLKAYTRSTVTAKGGGPGETADGSQMCSFVADTNAQFYVQSAKTFGAFANVVGANSRSLWYSWMAGLDPDKNDEDFTVSLTLADGVPSLSWSPDNIPNRIYSIFGKCALDDNDWFLIPESDLPDTKAKFFKVLIQDASNPSKK